MAQLNKTNLIKSGERELIKSYITYDGSSRMEIIYEAPSEAIHGAPCLKTQYEYDGATTRIEKMKESEATWDSTWDI